MPRSSSASARAPRWARLIDSLCLALLALAIVVAAWGGFRMRVGGLQIAMTSPGRLLLWAAALTLVRHVLAPGAPIHRDLPRRLVAAWAPDHP